ncbi:unnamed protein product [Urochloa decumbens]|uniref:F-box domain-containing protein n=1 Tax=Urochloa decumbens TaxID=240449 RepID=A0ABC9BSQ7_9POAL
MASKRSKRVASCLPGEIISEIMLLLPARSVLRFRAVCRQWAAQLSSPGFMGAYAARAGTRRVSNPKLVIFAAPPGRRATAAYSCSSSSSSAADTLFTADHLRPDFLSLSSRPCRGLVLLSDARAAGSYWVCNPSTGERRPLPLPPRHRGLLVLSSAGLGVDDRTMECKVVHLFSTAGSACGPRCEVYTLGGRWRPVAATALEWLYDNAIDVTRALQTEAAVTRTPPVHAGGSLHWLVYPTSDDMAAPVGRDRGGGAIVLRFSVSDESFGFVDVPASLPMEDYVSLEEHSPAVPVHLAELRGSLCMVHDLRRRPRGSLDVWVLRGCNNNAGGWSLEYRIPVTPPMARDVHGPRFITVLGACIAGEQEKLLVATSEHKVFAYATGTGRVEAVLSVGGETTGIGLQREATAGVRLGLYEDSLVRISRHKEQVMSASVAEILLRLPLKSIAQSMLVCREWRALMESESFVTRHAMMEKSTKTLLMVTNGRARRAFFAFTPLDRWLLDQAAASPAGLAGGRVVCSKPCHGLNLISTGSDDYLCNPCTGDIKCLGIRGKSRFGPRCQPAAGGRHAFTVGRKVGFGLDRSTGEHVAVEIGHDLCGAPACMLKTSESDYWTCAGTPPVPVTDMPPAHVDGTLYWTAEQAAPASSNHRRRLVIVAFDISARTFGSFQCDDQPCPDKKDPAGAFLVELNSTLSLVTTNRQAEEMAIWVMRGAAWVEAHRVCLRGQPGFSPRTTTVVVPLEIIGGGSGDGCRILLSTGRALGYYDTTTGALDTVYSLDHLRPAAPDEFAVPMLCQESLVRVPDDDELPVDRVAPPPTSGCNHPEHHAGADDGEQGMTPRPIFHECQNAGCRGRGDVYSACCKRLICVECLRRCPEHHRGQHFPLSTVFDYGVVEGIQRHGLPVEHPFVPDPDRYGYYYSAVDGDHVVRHVFISLRDFVRHNQPCHLTECAYRMDGRGKVVETWVRRYLKFDFGREPLA